MKKYQASSSIIVKDIAGDKVLFRLQQEAVQNDAVFVLNETGAQMWQMLKNPCTVEQLADHLVDCYGIKKEQALTDSEAFILKCINSNMIDVMN